VEFLLGNISFVAFVGWTI